MRRTFLPFQAAASALSQLLSVCVYFCWPNANRSGGRFNSAGVRAFRVSQGGSSERRPRWPGRPVPHILCGLQDTHTLFFEGDFVGFFSLPCHISAPDTSSSCRISHRGCPGMGAKGIPDHVE